MNDTDLCWMSAADLAAAIARKKVSPVEVVDATLARIDKLKELNAPGPSGSSMRRRSAA